MIYRHYGHGFNASHSQYIIELHADFFHKRPNCGIGINNGDYRSLVSNKENRVL